MSSNEPETARLHAIVEGRVQGVGFRYFVEETAVNLGLQGWVRNRWEGSVEVVAEGPRASLEKLLAALQRGPRAAFVSNIENRWLPPTGEFSRFYVRSTA
ncbi:MAG: acylphosphatase [Chloroflexota bacterium]